MTIAGPVIAICRSGDAAGTQSEEYVGPQVTPVWFQWDGSHVLINSAEGRIKDRNMRRNPQVALTIVDVGNPYRHVAIRGTIDEITLEGADDHIDKLAKKYLDKDKYPFRAEGEVRVIYKVRPDRVATMG